MTMRRPGEGTHGCGLSRTLADHRGVQAWRALGTYVRLATEPTHALPDAVHLARAVIDEVDRACSRFRTDSDLVRANSRPGRPTVVDPLLAAAVGVAVNAAAETDGLVDPTLGNALVAVGYDRDFPLLARAAGDPVTVPPPRRSGVWREVEVDPAGSVTVPPGSALDLGATGKAWAADLVAASVVDALDVDVVVSLGGDVASRGRRPWPVAVSELVESRDGEVVLVHDGGLATSTTLARRWVRGGRTRHHLLDPHTGEPTRGPWRTVSAFGRSAVAANTASTASIVLGRQAMSWLEERDVAARLVGSHGSVVRTRGWDAQAVTA